MAKHNFASNDRGETLVEILMSLVLLSGAIATLVAGALDSFSFTSARDTQANLGTAMYSVAQRVQNLNVTSCANTSQIDTALSAEDASLSGVTLGTANYFYGTIASGTNTFTACDAVSDHGVLEVVVPVQWTGINITGRATSGSQTLTVVVGK